MKRNVLTLLTLLFLSACSPTGNDNLDLILDALNENPDSALTMFRRYRPIDLNDETSAAEYALVRAKVYDANSIQVPLDSLTIATANHFDYFSKSSKRAVAYYYLGRAHYDKGSYSQAIVDFGNALHTADELNDIFDIMQSPVPGLAARYSAESFRRLGDEAQAHIFFDKAINYFSSSESAELNRMADETRLMAVSPQILTPDSIHKDFVRENSARFIADNYVRLIHDPVQKRSFVRVLFYVTSFLCGLVFIALVVIHALRKRHRIIRNKDFETIARYSSVLDSMYHELETTSEENVAIRSELSALNSARHGFVNTVCDIIYRLPEAEITKSSALRSLLSSVRDLYTSPRQLSRIETETDKYGGGVIALLRSECHELKEDEIRLFLYNVIGFSSRTVSVIADMPLETVYNKKGYLKRKIKTINPPSLDLFMSHF